MSKIITKNDFLDVNKLKKIVSHDIINNPIFRDIVIKVLEFVDKKIIVSDDGLVIIVDNQYHGKGQLENDMFWHNGFTIKLTKDKKLILDSFTNVLKGNSQNSELYISYTKEIYNPNGIEIQREIYNDTHRFSKGYYNKYMEFHGNLDLELYTPNIFRELNYFVKPLVYSNGSYTKISRNENELFYAFVIKQEGIRKNMPLIKNEHYIDLCYNDKNPSYINLQNNPDFFIDSNWELIPNYLKYPNLTEDEVEELIQKKFKLNLSLPMEKRKYLS